MTFAEGVQITLSLSVQGEEPLKVQAVVPKDHVDAAGVDVVDVFIGHLAVRLRHARQLAVHGECVQEGCGRPKLVQMPGSPTEGMCGPHAWEADQAAAAVQGRPAQHA